MTVITASCLILGILGLFVQGYSCGKHEATKHKHKEIDDDIGSLYL